MLGRNTEHTRTLRKTLVCTLLLSILLITLLNIKPVYAQTITLSQISGVFGSSITVSGSGFSSLDTSCTISGVPVSAPTCTISGGSLTTASFIVGCVLASTINPYINPYTVTVTGTPEADSAQASFV